MRARRTGPRRLSVLAQEVHFPNEGHTFIPVEIKPVFQVGFSDFRVTYNLRILDVVTVDQGLVTRRDVGDVEPRGKHFRAEIFCQSFVRVKKHA